MINNQLINNDQFINNNDKLLNHDQLSSNNNQFINLFSMRSTEVIGTFPELVQVMVIFLVTCGMWTLADQ